MKISAVTFTTQGEKIINKIKKDMQLDHYCKKNTQDFSIKTLGEKLMKEYDAIIFVSAIGIAIRTIANHITSKEKDPAVIVIDQGGQYVISLLSGHIGGANELTKRLAVLINARPIITTATDIMGVEAPDNIAVNNNCIIDNMTKAKKIAMLLVEGEKVAIINDYDSNFLPLGYVPYKEDNFDNINGLVHITNKKNTKHNKLHKNIPVLKLIKKNIVLGIGCKRNYSKEKMIMYVDEILKKYNIDYRAVKTIATVEIKKNEKAIIELAKYYNCQLKLYSVEEIKKIQNQFEGSNFVEKSIGVRAVCEPCVVLSKAEIIVNKLSFEGMTLSIGQGV